MGLNKDVELDVLRYSRLDAFLKFPVDSREFGIVKVEV